MRIAGTSAEIPDDDTEPVDPVEQARRLAVAYRAGWLLLERVEASFVDSLTAEQRDAYATLRTHMLVQDQTHVDAVVAILRVLRERDGVAIWEHADAALESVLDEADYEFLAAPEPCTYGASTDGPLDDSPEETS